MLQQEESGKRIYKNVTENVVYNELFITKISNKEHDREIFIADSGAMSHMVNSEENITNLKNAETRVTVGDRKTLTEKKHCDWHGWHGWQKHNEKIHHVTLINTDVIPGLHGNYLV